MKWLTHLLAEKKASRIAPLVAAQTIGQPVWTPRRYDKLSEEGYQKNPIVYRAVSLISRGVSSVRWKVIRENHTIDDHPLLQLLKQPNPNQATARFMEALTGYLLLSGNVYVESVGADQNSPPMELYLLRPDRMKVIPGRHGLPSSYEYAIEGHSRRIPVNPLEGTSPLLHLKTFNPLNDWYGMSPIEAAAQAIDQHNQVSTHNLALLQNGARPSGAIRCANQSMTQEQRDRLKEQIRQCYGKAGRVGSPLVLEGSLEWKEMGLSPKDLDYIEGKFLSAREIAQAYGVPSMLVGVPGDATFSNYREARYHLWEDTILPLLEAIKTELNQWLVPTFNQTGEIVLDYDTESIAALAPKRETA